MSRIVRSGGQEVAPSLVIRGQGKFWCGHAQYGSATSSDDVSVVEEAKAARFAPPFGNDERGQGARKTGADVCG